LLVFLNRNPAARARIPALPDRTVVYSGGVASVQGVFAAWKQLAQAKAQDPRKFDYVTLEERLRSLHVIEFGETSSITRIGRALSGIYVRGAIGRVRALILPAGNVGASVFALTEASALLRPERTGNSNHLPVPGLFA
jgi:hypothetical protein